MIQLPSGKFYSAPYVIKAPILFPIVAILIIFLVIQVRKREKLTIYTFCSITIFTIYLYFLTAVTLFPINYYPIGSEIYNIPFGKQMMYNFNILNLFSYNKNQLIGNFILLMPFSFFISILKEKYAHPRTNFIMLIKISLSIEILQLVTNYFYIGSRIFDINDLILNIFGGFCGYIIFTAIKKIFSKEIDIFRIG